MREIKTKIDLAPLSDEEIAKGGYALNELWMIKLKTDVLGPFDTKSLRDYSSQFDFLFENTTACNLEDSLWKDFFSITHFQRRKPSLVSAHNLENPNEIYILFNGQKDGPYSADQIQDFLDRGHIISSSNISLDKGKSWIKLYQYHAFDRRNLKTDVHLPFKPSEDALSVNSNFDNINQNDHDSEDVLFELLSLGRKKLEDNEVVIKKEEIHDRVSKIKKPISSTPSFSGWFQKVPKKYAYAGALSFCFVFATVLFNSPSDSTKNSSEVFTKVKSINNTDRTVEPKRTPASVSSERKVRSIKKRARSAPKRYAAPKYKAEPKKIVKKLHEEIFENEIENIDIDDPVVQEELTRQLAGEYGEEEYYEEKDEYAQEEPYAEESNNQVETLDNYDDVPANDSYEQNTEPDAYDQPIEHEYED